MIVFIFDICNWEIIFLIIDIVGGVIFNLFIFKFNKIGIVIGFDFNWL